ncbi:hypothetical protein PIB30_075969 [Stylosanthes scabra]|uniref:Uncharacterized protein n=1 Tax=Stylosanthes scabra TaxID=79078 RepID=A0ABU6YRW6_9FABA|nr:hypothetical protein [Stylosanthes scabra]
MRWHRKSLCCQGSYGEGVGLPEGPGGRAYGGRDSALSTPLLNAKIKSLTQELAVFKGEHLSALTRMTEVEEKARVQVAQLESCGSALEKEKKEAEGLAKSLRKKQTALNGAEAATAHWRDEWKALAEETGDMVQETFEILMDQVRHLNHAIDYSMISLDTRWDSKAKKIYNPKAEAQGQSEPMAEEQLDPTAGVPLGEGAREDAPEGLASVVVEEGGECPVGYVPSSRNVASLYGTELVGAFSECLNYPVKAFPVCSQLSLGCILSAYVSPS